MTSRTILYHVGLTLYSAAAMLGLFTVTGFPEPLSRQLFIVLGTAIVIQVGVTWLRRSGHLKSDRQQS